MCQNGALLGRPDFLVGRTATGACGVSSGAERSGRDSDGREVGTIPSGIGGRSSDGGCVGAGGNITITRSLVIYHFISNAVSWNNC